MSETADADSTTEVEAASSLTDTRPVHPVVNRVRTMSLFFFGIGVFAVAGFALLRADLFAIYRSTYFAVGVVVGLIGALLWLVTR